MIDVDEAVRRIVATGAPVLFLDTCALLDIMRDPAREKFSADHVKAAQHLLARAEATPPTLSIVLAQQVENELLSHLSGIERETEQAISRFEALLVRTFGVMNAIGITPTLAQPNLSSLGFPALARAIVQRFHVVSQVVAERQVHVTKSWDRVRQGIAPAARAKQSFKDCVVIETYLDVAKALRSAGFGQAALFFTTNVADYTEGTRRKLHPQLEADFTATTVSFATEFLAARYTLYPSSDTISRYA